VVAAGGFAGADASKGGPGGASVGGSAGSETAADAGRRCSTCTVSGDAHGSAQLLRAPCPKRSSSPKMIRMTGDKRRE